MEGPHEGRDRSSLRSLLSSRDACSCRRRWSRMRVAWLLVVALFFALLLTGPLPIHSRRPSSEKPQWERRLAQSVAADGGGGGLAPAPDADHFVRVVGGRLSLNCRSWYAHGWNQWETVEAAAGALQLYGASLPPNTTGPALIRRLMDKAAGHNFTSLRAWAHAVNPQYAMETGPGQYNEAVFRGLDYLLDEARQRGIRVLLSITDNWQPTGGADQFVRWAGLSSHEAFFSDPGVKQLYKAHVKALLTRVNSINGRVYSEDSTIWAWDLINEPRCYQCGAALKLWVDEMAAYVKSLDPNHLLTVGEEGFYPSGVPQSAANPQGLQSWAFLEGQTFAEDHSSPAIDFMAMHLWVDNWQDKTLDFVSRWVAQHAADARAAGKPLIMEEFGKFGSGDGAPERDQYYRAIYDALLAEAQGGGPVAGAMFWQWYDQGQAAPAEEGGSVNGLFGIFDSDSVFTTITSFSASLRALSGQALAGCAADTPAPGAAAKDCSATRVNGQPGTGYEGPSCGVSINECSRQTHRCDVAAACVDTPAGYTCACHPGYAGDGFTCAATPALAAIQGGYSTPGAGQLACSEGADVAYPSTAPGWAYDPTGGLLRAADGSSSPGGDRGSRVPVSPQACMQACELAPGCDSFSYNPEQEKCFLKAGASQQACQAVETVCISARSQPYSCGTWQTYYRAGGPAVPPGGPPSPGGTTELVPGALPPAPAPAPAPPAAPKPNPALQSGATVSLIEAFGGQTAG